MVLNVLVACEESQAVTKELRNLGINAFSCDILPTTGERREWHIQSDVLPLLNGNCTFKTYAGIAKAMAEQWGNYLMRGV